MYPHRKAVLAAALVLLAIPSFAGDKGKPPKLNDQNRQMIIRNFEAEQCFSHTYFPMGKVGLRISPDGKVTPGAQEVRSMVAQYGPAAKPGDRVKITNVIFKGDAIIFEINGGPVKKKKWYERISVGASGGDVAPMDRSGDPTNLDVNNRGSYIALQFKDYIPELTSDQIKAMLKPVLDFNAMNAAQAYADEAVTHQLPALQHELDMQASTRNGAIWKDHKNILEAAMHSSDRWKDEEDDGLSEAAIRNSFYQPIKMKVFAWNAAREKDTVMTPMDSIKYHRQMLQTGFMVMDPFTGAVKAWVGGIDFKTYKFDHVNINTKRQVGSSIKPFLYSLAIEDFNFTPQTVCEATQQYFPEYNAYVPANLNPKISGTRSMASGLTHSINEVAGYIMKQFGPKGPQRFAEFLKQINIPTPVQPYPSLALGACELSVYEMLDGYTMFPTGGINTPPYYISRIEDKHGNVLEVFQSPHKEVLSQTTAYTMARMMQGPVDSGTAAGLRAHLGVTEMGGKTGTTNDNADCWFMGYTPQLLAGVWVGCNDRFIHLESRSSDGGHVSRPIWEYFFEKALADKTLGLDRSARFAKPDSTVGPGYDYSTDKNRPGAQGSDQGNGKADQYLVDTSARTRSSQY